MTTTGADVKGRESFLQRHQVGVPRQFAVGAILVVTSIYCVLLRILTLYDVPVEGILLASLFVTLVGVAQALLFRGQKPREASMLAGALAALLLMGAYLLTTFWSGWFGLGGFLVLPTWIAILVAVVSSLYALALGVPVGYLTGLFLAGVFLVAWRLPLGLGRAERKPTKGDVIVYGAWERFALRLMEIATLPFRSGKPSIEFVGMAVWATLVFAPASMSLANRYGWSVLTTSGYLASASILGGLGWAGARMMGWRVISLLGGIGLTGGVFTGWLGGKVTLIPGRDPALELKIFVGAVIGLLIGVLASALACR